MTKSIQATASEVDFLLSPEAVRDRAAKIFALTTEGKGHFVYNSEKLKPTVEFVLSVIRKKYPDLDIPFHSRWGHFAAGGVNRKAGLLKKIATLDRFEQARVQLDLVVTSVLLDAGAGAAWKYHETTSGADYIRSEGLGVASFDMFLTGVMSGDRHSLRADAQGLRSVSLQELETAFQVSSSNPLVGSKGRLALLNGLAVALENSTIFRDGRPGNIVDYLQGKYGAKIPAKGILRAVLDGFGPIWPGRLQAQIGSGAAINLGDVWHHPALGAASQASSLVPLHKLSQWMTYSLIEPIMHAGLDVSGVEELTGLAEYRNGGLLIDSGLVSTKVPEEQARKWTPDSTYIIEWRALTVHLLDVIGKEVQKALGKSAQEFPLAKVLEGGTWWAGRALAQEKRAGGDPPIMIESDGTVF